MPFNGNCGGFRRHTLVHGWIGNTLLPVMLFAIAVLPGQVQAGLVVQLGIDVGGDEMAKATFVDGESDSINAGELLHFDIGLLIPSSPSNPEWESQLTIGWKNDSISAENGTLDWSRFPVDFLQFYVMNDWRFGAGLTWHFNPILEGSGVVSGEVEFDNALGFLLEADYLIGLNREMYLGARVTLIEYEVETESVQADSFGAVWGWRFP